MPGPRQTQPDWLACSRNIIRAQAWRYCSDMQVCIAWLLPYSIRTAQKGRQRRTPMSWLCLRFCIVICPQTTENSSYDTRCSISSPEARAWQLHAISIVPLSKPLTGPILQSQLQWQLPEGLASYPARSDLRVFYDLTSEPR